VFYDTTLSGAAERPDPVSTAGTGYGDFWLIGNELTYDVDYSGLSSWPRWRICMGRQAPKGPRVFCRA